MPERARLPKPFILRRLHSLVGLWLVVYLCEHLFINAQAALFFKDGGEGFIAAVNRIHSIPYLKVVEVTFLALPFFIHGVWGVIYLRTGKLNAHQTDGSEPALPHYRRNRAYSWQRITSWLLLVGIIAHVVHMRFLDAPENKGSDYSVRVSKDPGLEEIAKKLDVQLEPGKGKKIVARAPNPGTAFLLMVRETFKSPVMVILYSILVIAACYHAFNGLWTMMITWGITLTRRAQNVMKIITTSLMGVVMFLGLMAAWGTYWTTQVKGW